MEGNKLYVGNLNYEVREEELSELFSQYGNVESVRIIEGKGFGFVEFSTPGEAEEAKNKLDGQELKGRQMRVNEAKPRENRPKRDFNRSY